MRHQYDFEGYAGDGRLVLIGEVKGVGGATEESAKVFRRNLIAHDLLPRDVYFLLAFRTAVYLWKPQAGKDASPDFKAAAKPVLKKFLGEVAENEAAPGAESVEFAFKHWLSEFTHGAGIPEATSDADRILLESGLYPKIRGGEIRYESAA
jgi:hypothetical protein